MYDMTNMRARLSAAISPGAESSRELDRIGPTRRPAGPSDGTQQWRSLLFCHWRVPVSALRPLVPSALGIDTFDGQAWIGLVPFAMRSIRPWWLPRRLAFDFLETNVRTYVHCNGRPGVWFFSLDASSRLAVWAARLGWSLPYFHARMQASQADGWIHYRSSRGSGRPGLKISFRPGESLGTATPGSLEHFLFERYLLFVEKRKQIYEGQVHHAPYQIQAAEAGILEDQLLAAAGWDPAARRPDLCHFSPGVDVEVFRIRPLAGC